MADNFGTISGGFFSLVWGDDSLMQAIREGDEKVKAKVMAVMEYQAPAVEAHAKNTAPWTDRTGNARQGLRAEAFDEGTNVGIVLYHQAPYGIWLEVKNSGEYAVINPTIEVMGPQVMAALERIMEQI